MGRLIKEKKAKVGGRKTISRRPSIEEVFYNNPIKLYHIRELSRITGIPKSTVAMKVKKLIQEGIVREEKDVFKAFRANDPDSKYRNKKMLFALDQIYDSGLVDYLEEKFMPGCIILFGSIRKGEYTEESDIDIFLEMTKTEIDLSEYEKKLDKKIQLFFKPDIKTVPENMRNNIANGIILSGYAKFF
ncbi:MAG: nucleotidyltransferase domain-containing protein [Candidatus Nanoarchaeia archaeon]